MKKRIEFYTDQELDAENGLYNYGARLYDPFIGRFISPDTIVQAPYNPQSLNRYSYCLNNPLRYTDPSGHFWNEILELVNAFIGFVHDQYDYWRNFFPSCAGVWSNLVSWVDSGVEWVARGLGFGGGDVDWKEAINTSAGGASSAPTAKGNKPDVVGTPELDEIAKKELMSWPKKENFERGTVILEGENGYYVHSPVTKGKPFTNEVKIECTGCRKSQLRAVIHSHPWYNSGDISMNPRLPWNINKLNDKPGHRDHLCINKLNVPNYIRSPDGTKIYVYERIKGKLVYRTLE
jgi:RHS repeat-associated protein